MKKLNRNAVTLVSLAILFLPGQHIVAQDVPTAYRRFFKHYIDKSSLVEQVLNPIGMTTNDVGRTFALVAAVSSYPHMTGASTTLNPASIDASRLVATFRDTQKFDEIVVLTNADVTPENLRYFLRDYFPKRLRAYPKSRFVFAFSGHGFSNNEMTKSYLLMSSAESLKDSYHAIGIRELKDWVDEVVDAAHQTLVLINACYGGSFVEKRAFGPAGGVPRNPGAHAITASTSSQIAWADNSVGSGSLFFESFLAGLSGRADTYPKQGNVTGDGIITFEELYAFIFADVSLHTEERQKPEMGDLMPHGRPSPGSFFFIGPAATIRPQTFVAAAKNLLGMGAADPVDTIVHAKPTDWTEYHVQLQNAFRIAIETERSPNESLTSKKSTWSNLLQKFPNDNPERDEDRRLREAARLRLKYWQLEADGAPDEDIIRNAAEEFVTLVDQRYFNEAYDRYSPTTKQQETITQFRQRADTYLVSRGGAPTRRSCFVAPRPLQPTPREVRAVRCEVHLSADVMIEDIYIERSSAGWAVASFYTSPGEVYR